METPKLKSGDTVVPLGSLSTTVAILCGSINAGIVSWELESPWWGVVVALAIGGTIGSLIGKVIARILYSAPGDQVQVVKTGPASLPKTLVASLLGAIPATARSNVSRVTNTQRKSLPRVRRKRPINRHFNSPLAPPPDSRRRISLRSVPNRARHLSTF